MQDSEDTESQRLKSVLRTFDIVEYLRENESATLSEVADHFGMPMSTAHVHLSTLVDTGYVIKEDNTYRCSLRFLHTGGQLRERMVLYRVAKSEIDDLGESVGEFANVGVEENGYMVQLYKSENANSIDEQVPIGYHHYLHTTAIGKAIISQWSEPDIEELIARRGLPGETTNTITDRDELFAELGDIREQGYSFNRAEHYPGICAVATPIHSPADEVLGAISISGPQSRIGMDRIEDEIFPALRTKRNIIEVKLRQLES